MTVGQALFSFRGRMKRSDYWLKGYLPLLPLGILNFILTYGVATPEACALAMGLSVISLWPGSALVVKRLHDLNHSAWFVLILLIPIAGPILFLIEVMFLKGTTGPNRFGDDPLQTNIQQPTAVREPAIGNRKSRTPWVLAGLAALVLLGAGGWYFGLHLPAEHRRKAELARKNQANITKDNPFVNSLGMKFVPVPGTEVLFCVWDVRVRDYRAYAQANSGVDVGWQNPGFAQGDDHPVVNVSWNDAQAFCAWLTQKERSEGKISDSQSYRLPADWEWSVAVGLNESRSGTPKDKDTKVPGVYPWGTSWPPPSGAGNYDKSLNVDNYEYTSPVGSFNANQCGLYDMGGNVWQWCEDDYYGQSGSHLLRGASWNRNESGDMLSSNRYIGGRGDGSTYTFGFRVVVAVGSAPK